MKQYLVTAAALALLTTTARAEGVDLLNQGMVVVTVIGDGRVYTVEEFALTFKG